MAFCGQIQVIYHAAEGYSRIGYDLYISEGHWHYFYKPSARVTRLAIELGIWRGIVWLEESITSIIIRGKLGAGEDT